MAERLVLEKNCSIRYEGIHTCEYIITTHTPPRYATTRHNIPPHIFTHIPQPSIHNNQLYTPSFSSSTTNSIYITPRIKSPPVQYKGNHRENPHCRRSFRFVSIHFHACRCVFIAFLPHCVCRGLAFGEFFVFKPLVGRNWWCFVVRFLSVFCARMFVCVEVVCVEEVEQIDEGRGDESRG